MGREEIIIMNKPPNLDDLAYDVLTDKYGQGETRKLLLGKLYGPVQERVDEIYNMTYGNPWIWCGRYLRERER